MLLCKYKKEDLPQVNPLSYDVLYAVNAKTEPAGSLSPELSSQGDVSLTGSTIRISDLLDFVNK